VGSVDHLVVGCADLDTGVGWIAERLSATPVFGGVHDGFGTRNALLGLGPQYLEVLAVDPDQPETRSSELLKGLVQPRVVSVAIARQDLDKPVPMSRVRSDGVRLEWSVEFTSTPLFFIDWKDSPRPTSLPDGGRVTRLFISTPDPGALAGVNGVEVHEGPWHIEASVNGTPLI
jgi:hypothetical protein